MRTNSEMINPWSKEALLQKYSIRQTSKASLLEGVRHSMNHKLIEKNLHTIRSYHDKASSLNQNNKNGTLTGRGTQQSPTPPMVYQSTTSLNNKQLAHSLAALNAMQQNKHTSMMETG